MNRTPSPGFAGRDVEDDRLAAHSPNPATEFAAHSPPDSYATLFPPVPPALPVAAPRDTALMSTLSEEEVDRKIPRLH